MLKKKIIQQNFEFINNQIICKCKGGCVIIDEYIVDYI